MPQPLTRGATRCPTSGSKLTSGSLTRTTGSALRQRDGPGANVKMPAIGRVSTLAASRLGAPVPASARQRNQLFRLAHEPEPSARSRHFLRCAGSGHTTAYFRPEGGVPGRSSVKSDSTREVTIPRSLPWASACDIRGWDGTHGHTGILVDLPELRVRSDESLLRRLRGAKKCCGRSHRGVVFATACSLVAHGSMIQSLLCGQHLDILSVPDFQSWLLDGAGVRERHRPRQVGLEPDVHGVQASCGQCAGLAA